MQREGFYIMPIRPPAVPEGSARLRISLSAEHTDQQITDLIELLKISDENETSLYSL